MKSISCIIPIYNLNSGKNWTRFCFLIKSLVQASSDLAPDKFELILVNDDPECDIRFEVESFLAEVGLLESTRILTNSENKGQAFSRNRGGKEAVNEYLHFIDQDDFVNESFYSEFCEGSAKDIYIANPFFYLEKSNREIIASTFFSRMMYRKSLTLEQLWLLLLSNIFYSPGQVLISKKKFIESGGFPILKNLGSDDYGLFYNLALSSSSTVSYMKSSVFYYRIHGNQSSKTLNMHNSIQEFFESVRIRTLKEKIIKSIKLKPIWQPLAKMAYLIFFRRAPRQNE